MDAYQSNNRRCQTQSTGTAAALGESLPETRCRKKTRPASRFDPLRTGHQSYSCQETIKCVSKLRFYCWEEKTSVVKNYKNPPWSSDESLGLKFWLKFTALADDTQQYRCNDFTIVHFSILNKKNGSKWDVNVKCSSVILLLQKNKKTLQRGHSELSISLQLHCTHRVWTKTISWPVPEETTTESKMLALFSFSEILYGFVWERGFTLRTELCNKLIFHLLLLNPFNLFFFCEYYLTLFNSQAVRTENQQYFDL